MLLAWIVVETGLLDNDPIKTFVLKLCETKMTIAPVPLFLRAVLANWLVCLGVWMAVRIKSEAARILMIWWCMFTFITSGYEHSIANMCGLLLGVLLPHDTSIDVTWTGYWYNLWWATLGNIVGGAIFVAGAYWLGSPRARAAAAPVDASANGEPQAAPVVAESAAR
jgi:nitrite transporter NirC